jgi:hypothetical protein
MIKECLTKEDWIFAMQNSNPSYIVSCPPEYLAELSNSQIESISSMTNFIYPNLIRFDSVKLISDVAFANMVLKKSIFIDDVPYSKKTFDFYDVLIKKDINNIAEIDGFSYSNFTEEQKLLVNSWINDPKISKEALTRFKNNTMSYLLLKSREKYIDPKMVDAKYANLSLIDKIKMSNYRMILYHGTSIKNLERIIKKNGILFSPRIDVKNEYYKEDRDAAYDQLCFTTNFSNAYRYARRASVQNAEYFNASTNRGIILSIYMPIYKLLETKVFTGIYSIEKLERHLTRKKNIEHNDSRKNDSIFLNEHRNFSRIADFLNTMRENDQEISLKELCDYLEYIGDMELTIESSFALTQGNIISITQLPSGNLTEYTDITKEYIGNFRRAMINVLDITYGERQKLIKNF